MDAEDYYFRLGLLLGCNREVAACSAQMGACSGFTRLCWESYTFLYSISKAVLFFIAIRREQLSQLFYYWSSAMFGNQLLIFLYNGTS